MAEVLQLDPDSAEDRFARFRLIGWWDQPRLAHAKILLIGAGALGNELLKNLALLGVGNVFLAELIVFFWVVGLVVYLLARRPGALIRCEHCGNKRLAYTLVCVHCGQGTPRVPDVGDAAIPPALQGSPGIV